MWRASASKCVTDQTVVRLFSEAALSFGSITRPSRTDGRPSTRGSATIPGVLWFDGSSTRQSGTNRDGVFPFEVLSVVSAISIAANSVHIYFTTPTGQMLSGPL
jgi:hypothetical protein